MKLGTTNLPVSTVAMAGMAPETHFWPSVSSISSASRRSSALSAWPGFSTVRWRRVAADIVVSRLRGSGVVGQR